MERRYALELRPGDEVDGHFALVGKEMRAARTGEAYLTLELSDRSGRLSGIMFRPGQGAESIPAGTVVHVRGTVTTYRGMIRVSARSLSPAAEFDRREILPVGTRDEGELLAIMRRLVRSIADPGLAALVRSVFGDARFMAAFRECPATVDDQRAYLGGLLEHTVGVATICAQLAVTHPQIDADLLVAGALLHDVGMVEAVRYDTGIEMTDQGRLVGHVVLGERRVLRAAERVRTGLAPEVVARLVHMVLSHHAGDVSLASVMPVTLEAVTLSHADHLDSEIARFADVTGRAASIGEPWTDTTNAFGRSLMAPSVTDMDSASLAESAARLPRSA